MSGERWKKVEDLFHRALELKADERTIFLKQACGEDDSLLEEVQSLLSAHERAGNFIQEPAIDSAMSHLNDNVDLLPAGQQLGAYQIIKEIARGGMGTVYLAARADDQYKKQVAIKVIKRGMDTDSMLRYFRKERQILADFDHANIARLLDGGSTETGLPYFVMEYVEGEPIDKYCDAHNLTITQRLELFLQVCAAVTYAHRHFVVHRDIKPSNIVVTAEGEPKLVDFGIAKILEEHSSVEAATVTGLRLMTPEYASPEQAQGFPVTTLSDVYSLGVLLYELLTGLFPYQFKNRSPDNIAHVITETEPQAPSTIINTVESDTREDLSRCREGSSVRLRRRLRGDLDNIVLMAMRKEPQRRYQSVEQFSEDVRRHLAGLPVIASKDTFVYRSKKFVRRNKVAVMAGSFAIFVIASLIAIAVLVQWRANQQAKFLQEFGQEVAGVDGIMRFAYMLPLHNTSAERKMVQNRINGIRARMTELGRNAQGPGHYAIGRGFMALQKYEEAQKEFKQALNAYGYKASEVAYSYGLTLAMLYQNELQSAVRIGSPQLREMRLKEIEKEFKSPALSYIREGRRSKEYSEYAEAVVQFLDEHYEQAIQRSEKAMQQIPWLYESKRLEGESYRNLGVRLIDEGKLSEALPVLNKAERAFEISIQTGLSDPRGYEALCSLEGSIVRLDFQTGRTGEKPYATGKDSCEKALRANPESADANMHLSRLDLEYSRIQYNLGNENLIRALFEESVRTAQLSVQLRPDSSQTQRNLATSYYALADYYYGKLIDPSKLIADGEESLQKAIQINPNDALAYYVGGQLLWTQTQYMTETGADPRKVVDRAIQYMQTSIRLNPKDFRPYHQMGNILFSKGEYEAEAGIDPTESLDSAMKVLEKGLKMNPGFSAIYFSLGYAALVKAKYLCLVGREPYEAIRKVESAFKEVLRLNPKNPYAFETLGEARLINAEYSVDTKIDPSSYLNEARTAAQSCLALNQNSPGCFRILGEGKLVAARWKMLRRNSPEAEFQSSLNWLNRSIDIKQRHYSLLGYQSKARLFREWAEWKIKSMRSADREIQLGSEMVSRALESNPHSGEMFALRGVFLLLQTRSRSNVSQSKEFAHKAQLSLQEALRLNANLSHAFMPYLKDAEALLNSKVEIR